MAQGGPIDLRHPTAEEQAALVARIRPIHYSNVYLLRPDSIEEHVIASGVYWAEYDLTLNAPSPLVSNDKDCQAAPPPIGGSVQFADHHWPPGLIIDSHRPETKIV